MRPPELKRNKLAVDLSTDTGSQPVIIDYYTELFVDALVFTCIPPYKPEQ